jgi:hypothetical protein
MATTGVITGSAQTLVTVRERSPSASARLADISPRLGWGAYNQDITGATSTVRHGVTTCLNDCYRPL